MDAIGPSYVATPRIKEMGEEALAGLAAQHPMGRLAEPAEVAELTAFPLSDREQFCTGASIR